MQSVAEVAAQQTRLTDIAVERDAGTVALQQAVVEAAGLRAAMVESEALLDAANGEVATIETQLMQSVAEIAVHQFRLTYIVAERDAGTVALQQAEVVAAGLREAVMSAGRRSTQPTGRSRQSRHGWRRRWPSSSASAASGQRHGHAPMTSCTGVSRTAKRCAPRSLRYPIKSPPRAGFATPRPTRSGCMPPRHHRRKRRRLAVGNAP